MQSYHSKIYIHERTQYSVDPGQPPLPLSSEPISNIFTFLESLDYYIWSAVFFLFFSKIKDPFLGKKSKNVPKSGVAVLFMRDYFNLYTKKVWSCMELFFVFETIENLPFMIKNQNPFCLSFGVSTITLLLIFLLIKVAYF